ncbi:MAG: branched-chain amino acid ABC transporter substrate-binding protein [Spirochaetota bacterium]
MSKSLRLAAFLLLAATMIFVGCAREQEAIKIGVAGPHSGDLASYGIPTVHAAELVAENVNADGGVLGRQIELIIEDDQCQPEVATNTASRLIGEEVVGVIGHVCSGATRPALGLYTDAEVVAISPSATNPALTQDEEFPYFFRTIAPDDAQGQLQAQFVAETLGVENVVLLHDGGDYGRGLADFAEAALQENYPDINILFKEGITVGAVDYSAIINRVAASDAEIIIYGGYHPEAARLVSQMRTQGMDTLFISGDGVQDDSFIEVAGEAAEGVYATGPQDTGANPLAAQAVEEHVEEYGEEPGPFFQEGYSAMLALVNAIEAAESTDTEDIARALRDESVETPVGNISFDRIGDAEGVGFAIYQVQNGVYVEL